MRIAIVAVLLALVHGEAFAQSKPDRDDPVYQVSGVVSKVFMRQTNDDVEFLVEISMPKYGKWVDGVQKPDVLYVHNYIRKQKTTIEPEDLVHSEIPAEGDKIQARLYRELSGIYTGYSADWYDKIPVKER